MRTFLAVWFVALVPAVTRAVPVATVDLAETTGWTVRPELAADWQPTALPDQVSVKGKKDRWVDFRRTVTVPPAAAGRVVLLHLDSVNDGGEIRVDGKPVGTVDYGLFPADVDLTAAVTPGRPFELTVRCYGRANFYRPGAFPQGANALQLLGVPRGLSLVVEPDVYVADLAVRTSVTEDRLDYDAWVVNGSSRPRTVIVHAALTGPGYPAMDDRTAVLPPHGRTRVTAGTGWGLGRASYWWPNIPFDEHYRAVLHHLDLSVSEGGQVVDTAGVRFGFRQAGESATGYTINGVPVFEFMDSTQEHVWAAPGHGDGFQTAYPFLDGWRTTAAAADTWRRYQRLGLNTFRLHSSAATPAMLDAADEAGFLLVGESAVRGYEAPEEIWDDRYKPAAEAAMARAYRGHPSVVRYSLDNEWRAATVNPAYAAGLIDAVVAEDATRPMSFSQDWSPWEGEFFGTGGHGHAWIMQHYHQPATRPDRLVGVEETLWDRRGTDRNELVGMARYAVLDRLDGYAAFGPWTLNNYWTNFVAGGSKATGSTNAKWRVKDRTDGVDGWGSDPIRFVQNCYSVYAAADVEMIRNHLDREDSIFTAAKVPAFANVPAAQRRLVVFNNSLATHTAAIAWELRLDAADGPVVDHGETDRFVLHPGEHATPTVTLRLPRTNGRERLVHLVLRTRLDGPAVVFTEGRYFFRVTNPGPVTATTSPGS